MNSNILFTRFGQNSTRGAFRHKFVVQESYAGLLYRYGAFVRVLKSGRHVLWGYGWTMTVTDLRKTSVTVPAQEVLTSDNVSLKLSALATYQVADPAKAAHETQNWLGDVYNMTQLALRSVVGAATMEALLTERLEIGARLLARVAPEAAKLGVTVFTLEVKDVMLPADLKRAFSDVLKAKQEGQAALERARGESAALRNLVNAARVLEGKADETDRCVARLREQVQKSPTRTRIWETHLAIGRSHYDLRRYREAVTELTEAQRHVLHPLENHTTTYWLAKAHEASGNRREAARCYQAVAADAIPSWMRKKAAEVLAQPVG